MKRHQLFVAWALLYASTSAMALDPKPLPAAPKPPIKIVPAPSIAPPINAAPIAKVPAPALATPLPALAPPAPAKGRPAPAFIQTQALELWMINRPDPKYRPEYNPTPRGDGK